MLARSAGKLAKTSPDLAPPVKTHSGGLGGFRVRIWAQHDARPASWLGLTKNQGLRLGAVSVTGVTIIL